MKQPKDKAIELLNKYGNDDWGKIAALIFCEEMIFFASASIMVMDDIMLCIKEKNFWREVSNQIKEL